MSVAGDEIAATATDDGERAEAIVLQFEHPIRVIEGRGSSRQRHRLECHRYSVSVMIAKVGRTRRGLSRGLSQTYGQCRLPLSCHWLD
jgi:hypothetical protein